MTIRFHRPRRGEFRPGSGSSGLPPACAALRPALSCYADGELAAAACRPLLRHLEQCRGCALALQQFHSLGRQLRALPRPTPTPQLVLRLRVAASRSSIRGRRWSYFKLRLEMAMQALALPSMVGTVCALVLLFALVGGVRSNIVNNPALPDVPVVGNASPPRLTQAPDNEVGAAMLVEADIDANGRVYGYRLLSGPVDEQSISRLNSQLLLSIFQPATTAFGQPTTGSILVSFGTVDVKG